MSQRRWPRVVAAVVSALVLVVTIIGAGVTSLMGQLGGNITALDVSDQTGTVVEETESLVVDEETGEQTPFTVLVMGSDSRIGKDNRGYGKASDYGDVERSDTTILLHVNADRTQALGVSIPRDTWITLPTCTNDGKDVGGYAGRFNEAMVVGGPGCVIKAVEEMSGLKIDNFMVVDFGGFKRITEAVGGVEICLEEPVNDPKSGLKLSAGKHVVSGEQALAFVRARKTLGDGSDTSRIRRQQAFLSSMARKVLSSDVLLNPAALFSTLNAATESLTTDPQLANTDNIVELAVSMKDLRPTNITFVTLPWRPSGDGATILINKKKAKALWDAMKNDTPWPPKSSADQPLLKASPESIRVQVINATGTKGEGKKIKKMLTDEGYRVVGVKNDKTGEYTTSQVIYDPRWDVSAKTLIYATGATGVETGGNGQTMKLIVGPDFTSVKSVQVSEAAGDLTANVNTADESFCAS
ncbi:MAG: hypothetical protein RJB01_1188 [Actinomycetota bacterium]